MPFTLLGKLLAAAGEFLASGAGAVVVVPGCRCTSPGTTCVQVCWQQIHATGSGGECLPQQPVIKAQSRFQALKKLSYFQQLQILALSNFHKKLLCRIFETFQIKM